MISVPGTIQIRTVLGRFGNFNAGTLDCSIGTFAVKDASIDEFDEGSYTGDFIIEKIKPNSYMTSSGCLVVEVRAVLNKIILDKGVLPEPVEPQHFQQDPIEEINFNHSASTPGNEIPVSAQTVNESAGENAEKLFGFLWPLGNIVKLDPTINRSVFRQQKDHLKSIGYRFVASEQHWLKEGI